MKPTDTDPAKARAEAKFTRQQPPGGADGAKRAEAEKTARLRELRLAKERSDTIAAEVRRARREMRRP